MRLFVRLPGDRADAGLAVFYSWAMLTNSVLIAVVVMLALSLVRVHVVVALFLGAIVGGLLGDLGLDGTLVAFQEGLSGGAKIALSYALLGAFAMAVANSGLPKLLADALISRIGAENASRERVLTVMKYTMLGGILAMSIMSQNLVPVHIAFIPLLIPPLLTVMNKLRIDRRLVACVLTFGLVTTYMYLPIGFGSIFLNDILLGNIRKAGMRTDGVNVMAAMGIPALGMVAGLLIAVFFSYRKPRDYADVAIDGSKSVGSGVSELDAVIAEDGPDGSASGGQARAGGSGKAGAGRRGLAGLFRKGRNGGSGGDSDEAKEKGEARPSAYPIVMSLVGIVACFGVQLWMKASGAEADGLLIGSLVGLMVFLVTGAVPWRDADDVFTQGMKMMAVIGFIMISAQGFAAVMEATGDVKPLVADISKVFADNRPMAAFAMLLVGLIVTMGIGSSFSTLPIITAIYVPLCASLGFSPLATVSIIGTAGALGDAGSPASDSTLGPTAGLNADGQHDHVRDTVIPTFLHFNLPLLAAGWIAAMAL